ncbi:hypothetical protein [Bradyrhizobium sp. AS23.2]|uniref:hypothetical protein n=1 Tax=Bradyrhizobium sp. AS23.2 TaxID=1680155 RepID=UPI000939A679|nr:hypothetical protein [Bradyrhizobium sp. AS23.2]OKO70489.1 hypothetical protein AC630_34870 [Bradyrhizobium sp. AS23.2]
MKQHHIRRLGFGILGVAIALGVAISVVLARPQPLFAYSVHSGRLPLYSDAPFEPDDGIRVLADIERRISSAPAEIADAHSSYRVFIVNAEWRRRLTFLNNYGAGGVNYYPLGQNVFLRQGDMDRLFQSNGQRVPGPRTLAYFGAHEIAHTLIGQRTGAIGNWKLPVWIREGLADYVAFEGQVDIDALTAQLRAAHPDLDPAASGLYSKYRLLVAYLLEREGLSVQNLFSFGDSEEEVLRRLLAHAQ